MEKQVRIFIGVTILIMVIVGLTFYAVYQNKNAVQAKIEVIEPDNELLLAAKQRATQTIDTLLALYPQHANQSFARFTYGKPGETGIHIWAKLIELAPDHATIDLSTVDSELRLHFKNDKMQLSIDQIEDWIIELPNGNIRGGFTTQALLLHQLKTGTGNKLELEQQLQQFTDKLL